MTSAVHIGSPIDGGGRLNRSSGRLPTLASSRIKSQSGVGLRAVGRGVACVVSSVGALPGLEPDSLPGLVVPPDDPARLAEAIIDHDDGLRRAIYDDEVADFTWLSAARQLRSELQRLGLDGARAHKVACTDKIRARRD